MKTKILIFIFIAGLLSACSGSDLPMLIAAEMMGGGSITPFPLLTSPPTTVIYTTTIDLEVNQVDKANSRVREITYQQGGYVTDSKIWDQDGEKHAMLLLVVAAYRFETVRSELLRLGTVKNERLSGTLVKPDEYPQQDYTHILVFLHPKIRTGFEFDRFDWRPFHTLAQAWDVFLSIFGFILDVAIWLVVVLGPFALIGWGIRAFILRRRKPDKGFRSNTDPDSQTEIE